MREHPLSSGVDLAQHFAVEPCEVKSAFDAADSREQPDNTAGGRSL
jgi:hypothetical protein